MLALFALLVYIACLARFDLLTLPALLTLFCIRCLFVCLCLLVLFIFECLLCFRCLLSLLNCLVLPCIVCKKKIDVQGLTLEKNLTHHALFVKI